MTTTNDYRAQADAFESITTLRRLVHELADRADALEHRVKAAEGHAEGANDEMLKEKRRADALKRALQNACDRMERARRIIEDGYRRRGFTEDKIKQHANWDCLDTVDLRAVLTDHPAQDGGKACEMTMHDGHGDGSLRAFIVRTQRETLARATEAMENLAGMVDENDGPYFEGYLAACIDGVANIRNLQPDQPADATEPNTRPRCSHTRLVKNHCPVCGPLDDDNRSVTDGDKATPDAAAAIRGEADKGRSIRQQISEAQEEVAAWPEWMTKSAKVHEPSCCARTREAERERCAQVADQQADYVVADDDKETSWDDGFRAGAKAAGRAIRRTGDTGGGDE